MANRNTWRAYLLKDGKRITEALYPSTAQNGYLIGIILKPEHTWSIEYVELNEERES